MAKRIPYANVGGVGPYRVPTSPTYESVDADGVVVVEKLCPIPYKRKMVDPSGFVVEQPLANGRAMEKTDNGNPYAVRMKNEKRPPKWLPYHECPVRKGYLKPTTPGDAGCDGDDGMGGWTPKNGKECCPHLTRVIQARKAKQDKITAEHNAKFANMRDKALANALIQAVEASKVGASRENKAKSK